MVDQQKEVWDKLWSHKVSYRWDSLSQVIYDTIRKWINPIQNLNILEAGSGTGKISLRLAAEGAQVTLVDYSAKALDNSREAFGHENCQGTFILSDIRNIQVTDNKYDLTWNAGVLEHFTFEEKVNILKEMDRITKPGGIILILTPFAKCLPYRVGKAYAEKQGVWMYGVEEPVTTLVNEFESSGIPLLSETDIGFVNSLDFLDFIPQSDIIKQSIIQWYQELSAEDQNFFPGYLLVSVGKKEE
ncbi:class I SAM-dependent methyltransferase [Paenibacillus sp. FA6]|uniref:class I SAM-dependent methyltransferase n=1 Tax=Paenibacillus sp. FA6 TaxID=3413029 RepID=UPI003F65B931